MAPKKIFVVDDHPVVRNGMIQLLSEEPGLSVCCEAASIAEALKVAETCKPDLAIIDLALPDGHGLDLIKRLKIKYPNLPILVSSMHDENLFAERALNAGARGYINKQESGDEIINAIWHILKGRVYVSPQLAQNLVERQTISADKAEINQLASLSNRELEIFQYIGLGMGTSDIASKLCLSVKTIETHRANIKKKLGLASGSELMRYAVQWSLENG